jgi:hypothetical protein
VDVSVSRYPADLTDEECALVEPLPSPPGEGGRPAKHPRDPSDTKLDLSHARGSEPLAVGRGSLVQGLVQAAAWTVTS